MPGGKRYAVWSLADQGLSSGSNLLLSLCVAHVSTRSEFGFYSIVMTVYVLALMAVRSGIGQPILMTLDRDSGTTAAGHAQAATIGLTVIPATAAGVLLLLTGAVPAGAAMFLICLPILLVQDVGRYACLATSRPQRALVSDVAWATVQVVGTVTLFESDHATVSSLLTLWALAGVSSVAGVWFVDRRTARFGVASRWMAQHRTLSMPLLLESVLVAVAGQLTIVSLGVTGGTAAIAALKSGQLLLGPLITLNVGLSVLLVPLARGWRDAVDRPRFRRRVMLTAAGVGGAAVTYGAVLLALPWSWGHALLGANWAPGRKILLSLVVAQVALGVVVVIGAAVRASADARLVLRTRARTAAFEPVAGATGAALAGPRGAAAGIALAAWASGSFWSRAWHRSTRDTSAVTSGQGVCA